MKRLTTFSFVVLMCFSFPLFAEEKALGFDELDDDGNGYLNQEEAKQRGDLAQQWTEADANRDGKLDISEFSAFEVRMVPPDDMESPEIGAAPTK